MAKAINVITGFYGDLGDGKTSTGVLFTLMENELQTELNQEKKLYSNIEIKTPNFNYLEGNSLVMLDKKLDNSIIFIDELQAYADSRNSNSIENKRVCHFFLQSRHTKSNVYWTSQYKDQVDKRIQRITKIDVICENLYYDSDGDGDDDLFQITIIDRRGTGNKPITKILYMKPIWDKYDSTERVNPFEFEGEL